MIISRKLSKLCQNFYLLGWHNNALCFLVPIRQKNNYAGIIDSSLAQADYAGIIFSIIAIIIGT